MGTRFATGIAREQDSYRAGRKAAQKASGKLGRAAVDLCIVFSSSRYEYEAVLKGVNEVTGNAPLIGCSTAGEFTEEAVEKGSVACALISSDNHKFFTGIGKGLRRDEIDCIKQASKDFPATIEDYPYFSYILCEDGLSGKGEETALAMLSVLGANMKFAGGSAGDDLKMESTYSFCGSTILDDAVSLALIASKKPLAISVHHGHSPISPPLTVTRAKDNIVYEIDGKSAFSVWKEYAREDAKNALGIDVDSLKKESGEMANFFTRYEAGLYCGGTSYKIRWPGSTPDTTGPLVFGTAIPEGTVLRVMSSPKENQVISARRSAEKIIENLRGRKLAGVIVFDCVVRAVILQDEFKKAMESIKDVLNVPFIGFETYGEFAMEMGQMTGYHNTTTVIMAIPE